MLLFIYMRTPLTYYLGKFLGIIDQDPSVSNSNRLHAMIFWFVFINLRYILESYRMIGKFHEVLNFNCLKLNQFIHWPKPYLLLSPTCDEKLS